MKYTLLSVLLFISFFLPAQDTARRVKEIKSYCASVDAARFSREIVLRNEEVWSQVTDGGVELKGLFRGDSLLKMVCFWGLSYGVITETYYLKNGKLVFVREEESDFPYDETKQQLDQTRTVPVFEESFYFTEEKLLLRVPKGKKKFNEELYYDSQTREGVLISNTEKYSKQILDKKQIQNDRSSTPDVRQ